MARTFLVPIDMGKLEVQNQRVHNLASAPASPVTGQIYYDTGTNKLFYWNGSAWVDTSSASVTYATTADIANVDHAAESAGVATTVARGDHKHDVNSAAAGASAPGDAAAAGTATTLSLSDHKHSREVYATTTQLADVDAAAEAAGTDASVARGDHKHALSVGAVTAQTTFGASSANGTANSASRSDHVHGTPAHTTAIHQEMLATADLTDWPRVAALDLNSQKITSLLDPTGAQDAATKAYVDATAAGIDWKGSVRAATVGANIATLAGGAPNTLDGVTLAANDRILVKDQTTGSQNGIYTVTTLGTGANGTWTRATDADASAEVTSGMAVFVEEGTVNADTGWVLTTNNPITLGTTALVFTQFTSLGQVTAGAGLTKTGSTIDVIAGASPSSGGPGGGLVVAADSVAIDTAVVVRKFAVDVGNGALTSITVTHNLGTLDVTVEVFRNSDGVKVECDVTHATTNTLTLVFAVAPTSNQYRCVVHG